MSNNNKLAVIVMAAGKGTRMKSKTPKVLHKLAGKSMLDLVLDSVQKLSPDKVFVIVGHEAETVKNSFDNRFEVTWVEQKEQLGTGHAIMQVIPYLEGYDGKVLILSGDVPLLSFETISNLFNAHVDLKAYATILTTIFENPHGYGRIIKDTSDNIIKIVEEKDASSEEKAVKEINSGTYVFDWSNLKLALGKITPKNAQGEYYLTDVIKLFVDFNLAVKSFITHKEEEVLGINDRLMLAQMSKLLRKQINEKHLMSGVTMIDPDSTYIDVTVSIGSDTTIYPNTILEGNSIIGENCIIGPNSHIINSEIGSGSEINSSSITDSKIAAECKIGPFARIREKANLGKKCKIGNFVEIKKSVLDSGVKSSHLAYLGDAEIGSESNIGAGTITCNYDGKNKNKTIIGENVFVGSNSTLVAPLLLEKESFIAAGSVITQTVPQYALGVGRSRQNNKENWVLRKKG